MPRTLGNLGISLSILVAGHANAAQAQTDIARRPFTAAEKARLRAGKLVSRPVNRRRGGLRLMGGVSWQVLKLPPKAVWKVLNDPARYRRWLPEVKSARVVARGTNQVVVHLQHGGSVVEAGYYLKIRFHPERRDVTFVLDDRWPHSIRAAWGFFTVRQYGRRRSLLAYGVMADIGSGLFTGLMRSTVHEWMLKVPLLMRRYAEGSARKRYL